MKQSFLLITNKETISKNENYLFAQYLLPILINRLLFLPHLDKIIPGGFVAELGVGARRPLCFAGKPLDLGAVELAGCDGGGGILPVLLP